MQHRTVLIIFPLIVQSPDRDNHHSLDVACWRRGQYFDETCQKNSLFQSGELKWLSRTEVKVVSCLYLYTLWMCCVEGFSETRVSFSVLSMCTEVWTLYGKGVHFHSVASRFTCFNIYLNIPKRKLRFPGHQISWVSEWVCDFLHSAMEAAKETKFGTKVA